MKPVKDVAHWLSGHCPYQSGQERLPVIDYGYLLARTRPPVSTICPGDDDDGRGTRETQEASAAAAKP